MHEAKADLEGFVDLGDGRRIDDAQTADQALPVHSADLVQADGGTDGQAVGSRRIDDDFYRIRYRGNSGGDGRDYGQRAVPIADIVLDD